MLVKLDLEIAQIILKLLEEKIVSDAKSDIQNLQEISYAICELNREIELCQK